MNISIVITAICSLLFIMIGIDKFFPFMEPPCSMMDEITPLIWKLLGALQIIAGLLIWNHKYKKYVTGFFTVFMLFFIIVHLLNNTYDIGGAAFMAVLLGLLWWNPNFIKGKAK